MDEKEKKSGGRFSSRLDTLKNRFLPNKNSGIRRVFANFISLSFLQGANYIIPLITLPYLTRVLGVEKFGLIMFAQAFNQYFIMLSDYGFNLSATRDISSKRDDPARVSQIFSSVITIKFLFVLLGALIMLILVLVFDRFGEEWILYFLTFGTVIGQAMLPVWFFQGIEQMKFITLLNLLARLIFTISIFFVIDSSADYLFVPVLNSLGYFIAGIVSLYLAVNRFNIRLHWPGSHSIISRIKSGFSVFATSFLPQLYISSTTFILGLLTNNILVGYYAAATKIVDAVTSILYIISQAFYPSLSRDFLYHRNLKRIAMGTGLVLSSGLFIFSDYIVSLVFGPQYTQTSQLIRILSISPLAVAMIVSYGTNCLLVFRKDMLYLKITMTVSLLGFAGAWILIMLFAESGAGLNLSMSRVLLGILAFVAVKKYIHGKEPTEERDEYISDACPTDSYI
ncbi:MAG: flippase [Candidatus Zixiibacteriota bacterium]